MKPKLAKFNICTGCGVCVASCTRKAIKMVYDHNGFLMPLIDENLCVSCKACERICPALNGEKINYGNPQNIKFYTAWSKDDDVCKKSSSGGIASQIALDFLRKGNSAVYGAHLTDYNTVHHIRITNEKELSLIQGTYYIQSDASSIYSLVKNDLKAGLNVFFCGTPCQVSALYLFLNSISINNLFTAELICHGVASQFSVDLATKFHKADHIVSMRDKRDGWCSAHHRGIGQRSTYVKKDGSIIYTEKAIDVAGKMNDSCLRLSCTRCSYAHIERVADISLGDQWKLWENLPHRWASGASLVLANTLKGENLINSKTIKSEKISGKDVNSYTLFAVGCSPFLTMGKWLWLINKFPLKFKVSFLCRNWRKNILIFPFAYFSKIMHKHHIKKTIKAIEQTHKKNIWL